jgi:hypothetical protein
VEIERPHLFASVVPSTVAPGETASVIATVDGIAQRVHVVGSKEDMRRAGIEFTTPITVPESTPDGRYYLTVRAVFASGAARSAVVHYDVVDRLLLSARVTPASVGRLSRFDVEAITSARAELVVATVPFYSRQVILAREGPTSWRAGGTVPQSTRLGSYGITVAATSPGRLAQVTVVLQVTGSESGNYGSVLLH